MDRAVIVLCVPVLLLVVGAEARSSDASQTLELVQVLFRHGDRSPVDAYPTDRYQEDFWPQGFGQLTQEGMRQHYELGHFFRKQYIGTHFLSANYSRNQIVIWSTDVDRTLMSAAVDLAGFFPPTGRQVWNSSLLWQPIPVHTMPESEDYYLSYSADCPKYTHLQNESLRGEEYVNMSNKYKKYLERLNTNSGFNGSVEITNIYTVADPLRIERLKKLTLPKWTNETGFWDTLTFLFTYAMEQLFDSTAKAQLRGGPLLGLMIKNMKEWIKANNTEDLVRFHMYSAHDVTIVSLLSALGLVNHIAPPYASAVGVELWSTNEKYFVKVWYRNDTSVPPYTLQLDKCDAECSWEKFVDLTKDTTLAEEDIKKACGLVVSETNFWIPTIVGISLGVLLIVFISAYFIALSRKKGVGHSHLENPVDEQW